MIAPETKPAPYLPAPRVTSSKEPSIRSRIVLGASFVVLLWIVGGGQPAQSQMASFEEQVGYAYDLQRFSADAYGGHGQNLGLIQDSLGVVFVANRGGVLEYDGVRWRRIGLPNGSGAFSLALHSDGKVYVGGRSDLGFLEQDETGQVVFRSMLDRIPPEIREFGYVWTTLSTSTGVFFHTSSRVLKWDGQTFQAWDSPTRIHTAFVVHDRFFARIDSVGLQELAGGRWRSVTDGDRFAHKRVFFMTAIGDAATLVAAQHGIESPLELYLLAEDRLTPVEADPRFQEGGIGFYNGTRLPGGAVALSTLGQGIYIIRPDGILIQRLDRDYGVPLDGNALMVDAQGGLWIAHNANGISRLNAPAALTEFGPIHGLPDVNDVIRFKDRFYTASAGGIYRLKQRTPDTQTLYNPQSFEMMSELPLTAWSLEIHAGGLFAGTERGIMQLQGDRFKLLPLRLPVSNVRRLVASTVYPDRLYLGHEKGLAVLQRQGAAWQASVVAADIDDPVLSVIEEADGTLWIGTRDGNRQGVWRVTFSSPQDRDGQAEEIDSRRLPWGEGDLVLATVDGTARFIPRQGLYRHEFAADSTSRFVVDSLLTAPAPAGDSLITLAQIDNAVWLVYRDRLVYATRTKNGAYTHHDLPQVPMPRWAQPVSIYQDEHGTLWIACGSHLFRYVEALDAGVDNSLHHTTLIRRVTVAATDSLLLNPAGLVAPRELRLDHATNDLTFDFVLPDYAAPEAARYRYRLEPYDREWSTWRPTTYATYRNLPAGAYAFHVQSRNRAGEVARDAVMTLHIGRPWYWSPLAWLVYAGLLLTPLVQFVRIRRTRQQLRILELERAINQRLNEANTQLRSANETLRQANRLKDEFLANASHELRTPLTAILGFTDVLKEEIPTGQLEFLELIDENGKRLLRTINSLLDLTKLRAGMLEVHYERLNLCQKAEEVVDMLSQLARNKGLRMYVSCPDSPIEAQLDVHCYERILYNLVGNAIKFTEEGEIEVGFAHDADRVRIVVRDTGVGIADSFLPHLYSEFKQEPRDDGQPEGSGLGLAITAHLVSLMQGTIDVKSKKGEGSTFVLSFPRNPTTDADSRDIPAGSSGWSGLTASSSSSS